MNQAMNKKSPPSRLPGDVSNYLNGNSLFLSTTSSLQKPVLAGWHFWNGLDLNMSQLLQQPVSSLCEGVSPKGLPRPYDDEPPCSSCRYTGMATCAGLSLYFLKLANESESTQTMAKHASKMASKHHKPFFYGGALFWAAAGIYRSMLD